MKTLKILTSLLMAFVILSSAVSANTLNKPILNEETNTITVSGNMPAAKNAIVTVQVLYPGVGEEEVATVTNETFGSVFSNVFQVKADSNGNFTTPGYTPGNISGKYSVRIMCNKYGSSPQLFEDAFMYVSESFAEDLLSALSGTQAEGESFITNNMDALLEDTSDFDVLSPSGQSAAISMVVMEGEYSSTKEVQNALECAVVLQSMKEAATDKAAEDIFLDAIEKYDLKAEYTPALLLKTNLTSKQNRSILSAALDNNKNTKIADYMTEICDNALLLAVKEVSNYANVTAILLANEGYMKIDLSEYEDITDKSEVNEKISTSGAESIAELCNAITDAISDNEGEGVTVITKPSLGGGGGGASSNKGGEVSAEFTKPDVEVPTQPIYSFTDMGDFAWARNAVKSLFEDGIINGISKTEFAPYRNITREEFVKLLYVAFYGEELRYSSSFSDVNENDWFYPYVSAASAKGLVSGVSAECFGAGQYIKRQDMAVLAYRFAKANGIISEGEAELSFEDKDSVAEYAKEAVATLSTAGVINGMGDNTFAPDDFSNRAQAAQLIYTLLNLKAGGEISEG